MVETQSTVVRRLGGDRAGTVGFGRFLANPAVKTAEIFAAAGAAAGARATGRDHVLAIQDTTHLSFPRHGGALGPGGDGKVPGLFLHPVIALDAADGTALGLAAGRVWTRAAEKVTARRKRALEDRESARWIEAGEAAKTALAGARRVTLIADRESDIYAEWARLPAPGFDLITRACQDRTLDGGQRLFAVAAAWPEAGQRRIDLPARKDRPARTAKLALRFGSVTVRRPRNGAAPDLPETVTLSLVEVEEINPPADQAPIHWRLLTTHAVADPGADLGQMRRPPGGSSAGIANAGGSRSISGS